MHVDITRIRTLNENPALDGAVAYWMSRDQRIHDNWALLYAQQEAIAREKPLVILFCLFSKYQSAQRRHLEFMIEGLQELQKEAKKLDISFVLFHGSASEKIPAWIKKHKVGMVITDFSPLRGGRAWRSDVASSIPCQMIEVDAHNVIPAWIASQKQEFAAATFRPKVLRLLPAYLTDFPVMKKHPISGPKYESIEWPSEAWFEKLEHKGAPIRWIHPGEQAALSALRAFLADRLHNYAVARNNPTLNGQSNLSPFLHFGMLSAQRVAWEVKHSTHGSKEDREALLEELIVRRELADNFCLYQPHYDSVKGFHPWAQASLNEHLHDKREYIYSYADFEHGKTHDPLWNAAQKEMVQTGKMHGYMRMYWAKKILEWTATPEDALRIAIQLNDTYELDGRDPNGYTGIAWSIGGVHDRPWFEHAVFGKIRYMNANGAAKKFDVPGYIKRYSSE